MTCIRHPKCDDISSKFQVIGDLRWSDFNRPRCSFLFALTFLSLVGEYGSSQLLQMVINVVIGPGRGMPVVSGTGTKSKGEVIWMVDDGDVDTMGTNEGVFERRW